MKHTPAPWRVGTESMADGSPSVFVDHAAARPYTGMCLARIYGRHDHPEERHANARLIAAAPELLEAAEQAQCECGVRERDSGHRVGCWMPALLDAIAKATEE